MSIGNSNPTSGDILDCARDLMQAFGQPELLVFRTDQSVTPESRRAALWLAVALGRCRLFGVTLGQEDGVLPPRIAIAAAVECSHQLCLRAEKAKALSQEFEENAASLREERLEEDFDSELDVVHFLFVCMDLWAAQVAIDEAFDACIAAEDNASAVLRQAITQSLADCQILNEAMQDSINTICIAAETELLNNWRALLVEPYKSLVPWWLDGTLETALRCQRLCRATGQGRVPLPSILRVAASKAMLDESFARAHDARMGVSVHKLKDQHGQLFQLQVDGPGCVFVILPAVMHAVPPHGVTVNDQFYGLKHLRDDVFEIEGLGEGDLPDLADNQFILEGSWT